MAGAVNIALGLTIKDLLQGFRSASQATRGYTTVVQASIASANTAFNTQGVAIGKLLYQYNNLNRGASSLGGTFGQLGSTIGGLFAADKLLGLGNSLVTTSGKFEKFGSVLRTSLQSGSAAQTALKDLADQAAATPYQLDELTGSFIKYVNRGIIPTKQQLTNFGDLAASQGKGFDQLTEAILDASSGEFERLKEFGIRASKSGDQVTLSFKGLSQTVKATEGEITQAIQKFGQMAGVAGSMNAVAQTQEGLISNLGDTYDRLLVTLGDAGVSGSFKAVVASASSLLSVITDLIANSPAEDLRNQKTELNSLVGAIALANDNESVRLSLIQQLRAEYPEFLGKLSDEAATNGVLASRLADVNAQYEQKIRIALGQEKIKKATEASTKAIAEQQNALTLLAKESGKSILELEKLNPAQRLNLARDIARKQRNAQPVDNIGRPVGVPLDYAIRVLETAPGVQAKAQAELNQLQKENAARTAELTKTTVDGYKSQISQIQEKIRLHQIDANIGKEEIKRLNDQIRVAQGKPLVSPASPVAPGKTATAKAQVETNTIIQLFKRAEDDLVRQIQSLSNKELEIQIKGLNENDPNSLYVKLRAVRSELERLGALTNISPRVQIDVIKELAIPGVNERVKQIVDNMTTLSQLLPDLASTSPFKIQLTDLQKLMPGMDFYRNKISSIQQAIENISLKGLAVPKEATETLSKYLLEVSKAQRDTQQEMASAQAKAAIDLAKEDISKGNVWSNYGKVFASFTDSAKESFATNRDQVVLTAKEMSNSVLGVLQQATKDGSVAMGEFIGGLISGTAKIGDIKKVVLGTIGSMLKQLGTTLVTSASLMLFVPGLQGQAVAQLGAGTGLIALGTAAANIGNYAKGGLFKDEAVIRVGESSRALAGGGEFVAPVALGAKLISEQIMGRMGLQENLVNQLRYGTPEFVSPSLTGLQGGAVSINVGGEVMIDGHKLRVVLQNANENQYTLG